MAFNVAVIGGGVAGLAVAFELRRRRPDWSVVVLEKELEPGGKVRSSECAGFTFDWGPNGFQPAPRTLELIEQLGLTQSLVPASANARHRYLYRAAGLRRIPSRPREFLGSELLSPVGKLRVALEPLLARRYASGDDNEETVHDFVARHFGRAAADAFAGPLVIGITAGDARELSLDALFPAMRRLELEHRSLIKGMARNRGRRPAGPALYSLPGGMGTLTTTLAESLAGALRLGAEVGALDRSAEGVFELLLANGERLRSERVVLAAPAFVAAPLLATLAPAAVAPLAAIAYGDVSVLALGYHRIDVPHSLDGFGFLVPRGERVRALGVLWTSSLFRERAPERTALLRVIAGGTVDRAFHALSDTAAIAAARRDLRLTMGIVADPLFAQRLALARAIPQYELGHARRVARAMAAVRGVDGLALAGNAYHGVAVNDCLRDVDRVVDDIVTSESGAATAA